MRRSLLLVTLAILASCGGRSQQAAEFQADDAERASSEPRVSASAAPGVAFNYRYAFELPALRIAAVQEEHAQACEKLGLSRCRITGMRYRLISERDIEAMLDFKL